MIVYDDELEARGIVRKSEVNSAWTLIYDECAFVERKTPFLQFPNLTLAMNHDYGDRGDSSSSERVFVWSDCLGMEGDAVVLDAVASVIDIARQSKSARQSEAQEIVLHNNVHEIDAVVTWPGTGIYSVATCSGQRRQFSARPFVVDDIPMGWRQPDIV